MRFPNPALSDKLPIPCAAAEEAAAAAEAEPSDVQVEVAEQWGLFAYRLAVVSFALTTHLSRREDACKLFCRHLLQPVTCFIPAYRASMDSFDFVPCRCTRRRGSCSAATATWHFKRSR